MLELKPLTPQALLELEELLQKQFPTASSEMVQSAIHEILKKFHMRQCTLDHRAV